tara:strand:+ start:297 stop:473 length:177 start_codon:yes stop_codon:yes gene_type:complete
MAARKTKSKWMDNSDWLFNPYSRGHKEEDWNKVQEDDEDNELYLSEVSTETETNYWGK